jgi:hypothetical protein
MKFKAKTPLFLIKWFNYEYWPMWLFYAPMFLYGIVLAIRARSFTYFTAANPGMKYGGAFDLPKMNLLNQLKAQHCPHSILIPKGESLPGVLKKIYREKMDFPLIGKPNIGERGIDVEKINNVKELNEYLINRRYDTIFQEFIDFPIELGVFYYRYPDGTGDGISSIVKKEFLSVTGNGKSTLGALLQKNTRARFRLDYLKKKYEKQWHTIIPNGILMKIEPIGNHNRGTKFLNGNHLISDHLLEVFREISAPLKGFYYGRYDLKVPSLNDLINGKNIKIMELNGVNSEPAHIYDPALSIWHAYKTVIQHMHIAFKISQQNRKMGVKTSPLLSLLKDLYSHLYYSKSKTNKEKQEYNTIPETIEYHN